MNDRQISTVGIVDPSVYLLTRKDSLCYNRLISLPSRTLISSQMKIETIIAFWWGNIFSTVTHLPLSTTHLKQRWPWQVRSVIGCADFWRMTSRQAFIACHSDISSLICLLCVGEMLCFICLCLSLSESIQEDVMLMIDRYNIQAGKKDLGGVTQRSLREWVVR